MGVYKRNSKIFEALKNMPPLYHNVPGEEYSDEKSQVLNWISENCEVMQYIWNKFNRAGCVRYSDKTKKWQGVNYKRPTGSRCLQCEYNSNQICVMWGKEIDDFRVTPEWCPEYDD